MAKKKNTQVKRSQRHSLAEKSVAAETGGLPKILRNDKVCEYILNGLVIIYFAFYIFSLYAMLGETFFSSDETFHAYVSSVLSETKRLPAELPEDIYGGYPLSYPPFFHILTAFVVLIAGFSVLKFVNLVLLVTFLISFYSLIRKHYEHNEAVIACLMISLSPVIATNTVRFMTEMLSMLLIFLSFFFLIIAMKKANNSYAVISGILTGLLILTKQIGFVVLSFYLLLLLWLFFRSRKDTRLVLYAVGMTVCIIVPYIVWAVCNGVEVVGFMSLFLGNKPEWATLAVKSFQKYDSSLKEFATVFYKGNGLFISLSFLLPLYHFIRTRGKDIPQNYFFLLTICLTGAMIAWHITNARHTIILLPFMCFLFGYAFHLRVANKTAMRAVILILLVIGGHVTYHMPNYRQQYNASQDFVTLAEIIRKDDTRTGRTLCIRAFELTMYSHKPVIWPYPNLRHIPIDIFEKQTPAKLYGLLKHYGVERILLERRFVYKRIDVFIGRNYPISFIKNCGVLAQQGKISLEAVSKSQEFLLYRIS